MKANAVAVSITPLVIHSWSLDSNVTNPRLDSPLGHVTVSYYKPLAILSAKVSMPSEVFFDFHLYSLRQHFPRSIA